MDQRTEPIRQDIDQIRESMTEKMQQIESKVKDTVDGTVTQVKQAFDIKQQVRDHTWASLGLAVLAGYVVGSLGGNDDNKPNYDTRRYSSADYNTSSNYASNGGYNTSSYSNPSYQSSGYSSPSYQSNPSYQSSPGYQSSGYVPQHRQQGGFMSDLFGQFGDELDTIKTAAVSSLVALLRDTIKENVPQFSQEYERVRHEHEMQQASSTAGSGTMGNNPSSASSTMGSSPSSASSYSSPSSASSYSSPASSSTTDEPGSLREQSAGAGSSSTSRTYNT